MNIQYGDNLASWSSTSMGASSTSGAVNIRNHNGFAQYVKWTGGTAAGSLKLQVSVDPKDPTNWEDLTGSTVVVAGAGSQLWNISSAFYCFYRVVFTRTGGTGTITNSSYNSKGQ